MSFTPVPAPISTPLSSPRPRRSWLAWMVGLLLIAVLAGGAYYLVQRANGPAAGMAQDGGGPGGPGGPPGGPGGPPGGGGGGGGSVTVGAALAQQGELPVLIEALGTVTPQATVTLVPQVSGTLTEVLFTEGQQVRKGQLLARIDARTYEQTLAQARATRARDEAQLAAARVTLQRYQTLWKQDSIAQQEVDTQAALVKQLEATVASGRATEQAAALNVEHTRIVSPIDGRVGLRAVDAGNLVNSGSATGIATLTQMDPIDVVFAVPQDRIAQVRAASAAGRLPVTALDGSRARTLGEGSFTTLDNSVDTTTGTVRAKARFTNMNGELFPNQFVNVRLQLGSVAGVLVPVTAVRTGPRGDYVYVIDAKGVAHTRSVTRGLSTVGQVLITQGVQDGERVVTEGGDRVRDGGHVQLSGSARAGAATPDGAGGRGTRAAGLPASAAGQAGVAQPASASAATGRAL